jgi:ketosteroid isomerase-like protein
MQDRGAPIGALFAAIDRKDADGFCGFLAEHASFRYGNAPAIEGREAIRIFVAAFFDSIRALSHRVDEHWQVDDALIVRGTVTYTRPDGSRLAVPFVNVLKLSADRLVREYQVYVDASALFSPRVPPESPPARLLAARGG